MNSVIMLGAGGHAKVIIELLRANSIDVDYCIGNAGDGPDSCLGVPIKKGDEYLAELWAAGYRKFFPAIGDNKLRVRLSHMAQELGFMPINAISPAAIVSPTAKLGIGIAIMAGAIINADSIINDLAIINTGATIDHDCLIGSAVHIGPQCALAGNVEVGSRTFLGIGTKVIPGIVIGEDVITGAGSVVISSVAPGLKLVGVPARIIK